MSTPLSTVFAIGFHGLALAMVLYLISVGLSVTDEPHRIRPVMT